jgi:hypothetical protein
VCVYIYILIYIFCFHLSFLSVTNSNCFLSVPQLGQELPYGLELLDGVLSGEPLASSPRQAYVKLGAWGGKPAWKIRRCSHEKAAVQLLLGPPSLLAVM